MSAKEIVIRTDSSDELIEKIFPAIENIIKELAVLLGDKKETISVEIAQIAHIKPDARSINNVRTFRNVKDPKLPDGMINPDYMRGRSVYNPKAKVFSKTGTVVGHCYSHAGIDCFVVRPTSGGETQWMVSSCQVLNFEVKLGETIVFKRDGVYTVPIKKKK